MIEHRLHHYFQPTNNSCSQSSLAMLLSYYDVSTTPEILTDKVPVNLRDNGEPWGTINQQLATYCLDSGFRVTMYSADFQLLDVAWSNNNSTKVVEKLESIKDSRVIPVLGDDWSKIYIQAYIDFLNAGGELKIVSHMTTEVIDKELVAGPLLVCVCMNVLYDEGRQKTTGLRTNESDDINGSVVNHSVVVYGRDEDGMYLIADPWRKPGNYKVDTEKLLCSMAAAQIECDNLFFRIERK